MKIAFRKPDDEFKFSDFENLILSLDIDASGVALENLRATSRRKIYRLSCPRQLKKFIVKRYLLKPTDSLSKFKKYGLAEYVNYSEAIHRGIPVPNCCCYFEISNFGVKKSNGIVLESLDDYAVLSDLLVSKKINVLDALELGLNAVHLLYLRGANHIDLHPGNMLVKGENFKIIDWQYASFLDPPDWRQVVFQLGVFLKSMGEIVGKEAITDETVWLAYEQLQPPVIFSEFRAGIKKLMSLKKIPSKQRLDLDLNNIY